MEKYIIAVDMDGTLLNSENKISERNRNVLQRLIDDGHYVVPATGRTRELIPREFSVLRGVKWGIVENGCVVWDYDKNEMIWRKTMPKGMVSKILKDVENSGAKGWIFIIRKIFWIRQRRSIFILMIWRPAGHFVRNGRIWMMWQ